MAIYLSNEQEKVLKSVLDEASLDDVASVIDDGTHLVVQLPCFADQMQVSDDLNFRGIDHQVT